MRQSKRHCQKSKNEYKSTKLARIVTALQNLPVKCVKGARTFTLSEKEKKIKNKEKIERMKEKEKVKLEESEKRVIRKKNKLTKLDKLAKVNNLNLANKINRNRTKSSDRKPIKG